MPSAGSLLHQRLTEQRGALRSAEAAARAGQPTGLHDVRVAMRRLRSALSSFRSLVDPGVTEPLRDELRWAAGRLGSARDAEVVAELTERLLGAGRPAGLGEAVSGLRARMRLDAVAASDAVDDTLGSERFAAALALLDAIVAAPPFTDEAARPAEEVAAEVLQHEVERVRRRVAAAREAVAESRAARRAGEGLPVDEDRLGPKRPSEPVAARLHELRKAVKRLRYAAEAVAPVTGKRVRRLASRAEEVQTVLGDHHDGTVAVGTLRHLALDEGAGEAAAFLLGHLEADEERAVARLERRATKAVARLEDAAERALAD